MRSHGPRRFRAQRDKSSPAILALLTAIGVAWWDGGVLDGFVAVHRRPLPEAKGSAKGICDWHWKVAQNSHYSADGWLVPVEIKAVGLLNQPSAYRDVQLEFFKWCDIHGLPYFRWSTESDVLLDLGRSSPDIHKKF